MHLMDFPPPQVQVNMTYGSQGDGFVHVFAFNTYMQMVWFLKFAGVRQYLGLPCPSGSAVKNPPATWEMQGTWVQSLGQEDPLEESMPTHSKRILAWRISCHRSLVDCNPEGPKESYTTEATEQASQAVVFMNKGFQENLGVPECSIS